MIDKNATIKKNNCAIENKVDDEVFVIPVIDGIAQLKSVCCLNNLGLYIWSLIENELNVENIILNISKKYNEEEGNIESDILTFLNQLEEYNLIIKVI